MKENKLLPQKETKKILDTLHNRIRFKTACLKEYRRIREAEYSQFIKKDTPQIVVPMPKPFKRKD